MFPEILFPKLGSKRPPFLTNDQKSRPKDKAYRQSKTCKRETNGPKEMKLGLKYSAEYPLPDQRCSQKFFFQNCGLKGIHF